PRSRPIPTSRAGPGQSWWRPLWPASTDSPTSMDGCRRRCRSLISDKATKGNRGKRGRGKRGTRGMQITNGVKQKAMIGLAFASSVLFCVLVGQTPVIIIRHGTVIDGSGGSPRRADVAIADGAIVRVGNLEAERATTEIDATDLYVAPGFINIHSHASPDALPTAENMLTQGVTTEIVNPDGGGYTDIAQQLADGAVSGLAVNVGAYIGFNSIWADVVGSADRRPTDDEVDRMRAMVISGLEHGAWGVSAGLDYKPAYYAQVEEVVRVLGPAAKWRTNFPNHDRLTPESNFSSHTGVA